jgi:hypothetical protein
LFSSHESLSFPLVYIVQQMNCPSASFSQIDIRSGIPTFALFDAARPAEAVQKLSWTYPMSSGAVDLEQTLCSTESGSRGEMRFQRYGFKDES